jgi:hypothetical protein
MFRIPGIAKPLFKPPDSPSQAVSCRAEDHIRTLSLE